MKPEGVLEKRRERHMVEINKRRNAHILRKDRTQHGFVDASSTNDFLERAMEFLEVKNMFGLETLTKEFLLAEPQPNIAVLIDCFLQEKDEAKVLMLLSLFNYLYSNCQYLEVLQCEPVIRKCLELQAEPLASEAYKLVRAMLFVDKASCAVMLESRLFKIAADAASHPHLREHLLLLFENLCLGLVHTTDTDKYRKNIADLLSALIVLYQRTLHLEYLDFCKDLLQDIDDEQLVLALVEEHMEEVHQLLDMLKSSEKHCSDHVLSVAQLLELLFYYEDNVIATLMAADMGSYILPMIRNLDPKVLVCGLNCLESILITDDVNDYTIEYGFVEVILNLYRQYLCSPDITFTAIDQALTKCMECLAENTLLSKDKIDWHPYLENCLNRLNAEVLQFDSLTLLRSIYDQVGPDIWPLYDRLDIMRKIYEISKMGTQEDSRNQAQILLDLWQEDRQDEPPHQNEESAQYAGVNKPKQPLGKRQPQDQS